MKEMVISLVVATVLVWLPHGALADRNLRCGSRLISIGSHMDEVLDACGEPEKREAWEAHAKDKISRIFDYETERYRLPELIDGPVRMARWTYNLGSGRFIRYLEFENEILIRITTGDKGHD